MISRIKNGLLCFLDVRIKLAEKFVSNGQVLYGLHEVIWSCDLVDSISVLYVKF